MKYETFSNPINGLARSIGGDVAAALERVLEAPFVWADRVAERRHLAELDDHMLKDIGVSRSDLHQVVDKPFWRS